MNWRRSVAGVLTAVAVFSLWACASTGSPRPRAGEPETRTLQQVEMDGSVRVRANRYRGR